MLANRELPSGGFNASKIVTHAELPNKSRGGVALWYFTISGRRCLAAGDFWKN